MKKILPDLYQIQIPLSDNPLGYLNSYLVTSHDRNLIIDTGFWSDPCYEAMQQNLFELNIDLNKTDFLITHFHRDHGELLVRLATKSSKVYFGKKEINALEAKLSYDYLIDYMSGKGVPVGEVPEMFKRSKFRNYLADFMDQFVLVDEGDTINAGIYRFRCYITPGHTDGHVCLYDQNKKVFISGDHILNDITPGVQCIYDSTNPLQDYYNSLSRIQNLEVDWVLPGHREIFKDFNARIEAIKRHHDVRLQEMVDIMKNGAQDAYQIASQMKWKMSGHEWEDTERLQRWFATSETIAHLRYLEERGQVTRFKGPTTELYTLI